MTIVEPPESMDVDETDPKIEEKTKKSTKKTGKLIQTYKTLD